MNDRPALLIERLDAVGLLPAAFWSYAHGGGRYVHAGAGFRGALARRILRSLFKLTPVFWEDFPGSFFEAQRFTAEETNDALFNRSPGAGPARRFLRRVEDHELMDVALRKSLADVYTIKRVKTVVFLERLARGGPVVFAPWDDRDLRDLLPVHLKRALADARRPWGLPMVNAARHVVASLAVIAYAWGAAVYLLFQRGIVAKTPRPEAWRLGVDIYNEPVGPRAIYHDRFAYDDNELRPEKMLHVVRNRVSSPAYGASMATAGITYIEGARLPIPLSYLRKRLGQQIVCGLTARGLGALFCREKLPFAEAAAELLLHNFVRADLIERSYPTDVFLARDEYSVQHILRTLFHDKRGGRTIGFSHGDFVSQQVSVSYLTCHTFCFWSSYSQELLQHNARHSRRTCVIGAGIYGLDETFRQIREKRPFPRYDAMKGTSKIIGILPVEFREDTFVSRADLRRFFDACLEVLRRFPETVFVVSPKLNEYKDPDFRRLLDAAGSRLWVETETPVYDLLPQFDLMICLGSTSIGLEGLMAGVPVLFFDESGFELNPYRTPETEIVLERKEDLLRRVEDVLRRNRYAPAEALDRMRHRQGFSFDGHVRRRYHREIYALLEEIQARAPGAQKAAAR